MTDNVRPFRKPSTDLAVRMDGVDECASTSSDRFDVVLATTASPALDATLMKGARTRRYHIRSGRNLSEWYCQVWFGKTQHRGDRVDGVVTAQRLLAQYRREIRDLLADGWSTT